MLCQRFEPLVVLLKVVRWALVHCLHEECLYYWTHIVDPVFPQPADSSHTIRLFLKVSNDQRVSNLTGKGRVEVTSVGFVFADVSIKTVPSVEELAYVPSYAVLQNETSTGVLTDKGAYIQNELV